MSKHAIIHTDGASKNNPGHSGIGYVVGDARGTSKLEKFSEYIGITTNNVAEYMAAIEAIKYAKEKGYTHITLYSDSEIMVKQLSGVYKVKNQKLYVLYKQVLSLVNDIEYFKAIHIPREENWLADGLASNAALNGALGNEG